MKHLKRLFFILVVATSFQLIGCAELIVNGLFGHFVMEPDFKRNQEIQNKYDLKADSLEKTKLIRFQGAVSSYDSIHELKENDSTGKYILKNNIEKPKKDSTQSNIIENRNFKIDE